MKRKLIETRTYPGIIERYYSDGSLKKKISVEEYTLKKGFEKKLAKLFEQKKGSETNGKN